MKLKSKDVYYCVRVSIPEESVSEFGLHKYMEYKTDLWRNYELANEFFYDTCRIVDTLGIKDCIVELIQKDHNGIEIGLYKEWL